MKAIFHPDAIADLKRQARYLREEEAPEQVLRDFFESVRLTKEKIEENPRTWSFVRGSRRLRKIQMPRFRMQVVYAIKKDGALLIIEFIGPGVQPRWRGRL